MDDSDQSRLKAILAQRLKAVEARIEAACRRAGRSRADVTLVAVTKTISAEIAALLPSLDVLDLGESRPQELWRKAAHLSTITPPFCWRSTSVEKPISMGSHPRRFRILPARSPA